MAGALSTALAETLERFFDQGGNYWHATVWDLVGGLTAEQALWRPAPDRKCIWEIVRHMTFWRRCLLASASGRPVPAEDIDANNWTLPSPHDATAWAADLDELKRVQDSLTDWFRTRESAALLKADAAGHYPQFALEVGIIGHDSYHLGQIAYLRALMGLPPLERQGA